MSDASPVIEARGVSKTYGEHCALAETTFSIARGECFALLGPNGAGKTTLLRILTDILAPDTGTVSILGEKSARAVKDRIGYLPEERGLYKRQKVIDTLAYFARLKGLSGPRARDRARQVLEDVGMMSHAETRPEALSKGMAQRIQFAATLVHDPEVAIFDEPFSGLDPASSQEMQDLLLAEKARGRTLLLSTHQMAPVERLCDRLLMLSRGRVVLYGPIAEIRARFRTGTVRVEHDGTLPEVAGVEARAISEGVTRLVPPASTTTDDLVLALIDGGARLTAFSVETPTLEEIFIRVAHEGAISE